MPIWFLHVLRSFPLSSVFSCSLVLSYKGFVKWFFIGGRYFSSRLWRGSSLFSPLLLFVQFLIAYIVRSSFLCFSSRCLTLTYIAVNCVGNSKLLRNLITFATILDISTDLLCKLIYAYMQPLDILILWVLVLIIPIRLLWRIRINFRQKLVLGTTLCLSIVMVIIAIIRIVPLPMRFSSAQFVWQMFWQQIEACTAVIMASFSAFRSAFVSHDLRVREARNRNRLWYMDRRNLLKSVWRRRKIPSEGEQIYQLPEIPRATLTGMRTFVNGGNIAVESHPASWIIGGPTTIDDSETVQGIRGNPISITLDEVSSSSGRFIFLLKYRPFKKE